MYSDAEGHPERSFVILAEELGLQQTQITKFGGQSKILATDLKTSQQEAHHWVNSL
mgnify:CR=1 FL=1